MLPESPGQTTALGLLLVVAVAAASLCPGGTPTWNVTVDESNVTVFFGQSADLTTEAGRTARAGILAAFARANRMSKLQFSLITYNDSGLASVAADNALKLLCSTGVFGLIGVTTSPDTVLQIALNATAADGYPVPLVGSLSSAYILRQENSVIGVGAGGRTGVINVRPSSLDEISAILQAIMQDWGVAKRTALYYYGTSLGDSTVEYFTYAMSSLGAPLIANASSSLGASAAVTKLLGGSVAPLAVVILAPPSNASEFLEDFVLQCADGMLFYTASWAQMEVAMQQLSTSTRTRIREHNHTIYQVQPVPIPDGDTQIASEYLSAMKKYQAGENTSHEGLEAYIAGRLASMAAERALEQYQWPLTRKTFIDTVFRYQRTFAINEYDIGSYGDGVGTKANAQDSSDWCNQGIHQLYMTSISTSSWGYTEESTLSMSFSDCSAPLWTNTVDTAKVGTSTRSSRIRDQIFGGGSVAMIQLGIQAAIEEHDTEEDETIVLLNTKGNNTDVNIETLVESDIVAIAGVDGIDVVDALATWTTSKSSIPLIAPNSGIMALRTPFKRRVINLFPSAYQEMKVAVAFLVQKMNSTKIAVIWGNNSGSVYGQDWVDGARLAVKNSDVTGGTTVKLIEVSLDSTFSTKGLYIINTENPDSIIFLGCAKGLFNFMSIWGLYKSAIVMMPSEAGDLAQFSDTSAFLSMSLPHVYQTSVAPPLSYFSSSDEIRKEFETYVAESSQNQVSFKGFFTGKFLSAVISDINAEYGDITADTVVEMVYSRGSFQIGGSAGITVGPFIGSCSGTARCCNQGLDTVYVTHWNDGDFEYVPFQINMSRCGSEFDENTTTSATNNLAVYVAVPLGCAAIALGALAAAGAWRSQKYSWLNIKRTDVELNGQIGKGRFGPLFAGDWNGTTVAVQVVEKKEISKEQLQSVKEEIQLLHKLHHPNLLMLMGFCETKSQFFIVSEHMQNGSLQSYLRKFKLSLTQAQLIGIAFDVMKGIAYLHSQSPPIIHGNIGSQSIMMDGSCMAKVSDFWYTFQLKKWRKHKHSLSSNTNILHGGWVPPEIQIGNPACLATDVFSFAIVLWELFLPADQYTTLIGSSSGSSSSAHDTHTPSDPSTPSAASGEKDKCATMTQVWHPDIPPSVPEGVTKLLEKCWEVQPDRRPTILQILRNWPTTFASIGSFDIPPEINFDTGSTVQRSGGVDSLITGNLHDMIAAAAVATAGHSSGSGAASSGDAMSAVISSTAGDNSYPLQLPLPYPEHAESSSPNGKPDNTLYSLQIVAEKPSGKGAKRGAAESHDVELGRVKK